MKTIATLFMISSFMVMFFLDGCKRPDLKDVPVTQNVTFEKDIKPITSTVCISCHSSGKNDWSRYTNAYWARYTIERKVVKERSMPMGTYMSDKDRALFRDWVNQGAKR
jgi:uncharacterized membrane protein